MYLKIMDDENAPDEDSRKTYRLLSDVIAVKFSRISNIGEGPQAGAFVFVKFKTGEPETFDVFGNAYVMNDNGKTISSWGSMPYVEREFPAPAIMTPTIESELLATLEDLSQSVMVPSTTGDVIRRALSLMKQRAA